MKIIEQLAQYHPALPDTAVILILLLVGILPTSLRPGFYW
jgi:hypothetical protein